MDILDIRARSIESEGQFSFQVYDKTSGKVCWTCDEWFATKELSDEMANYIVTRVTGLMKRMGMEVDTFGGKKAYGFPTSPHQLAVIAVLAQHKKTGKFGFAVMLSNGDVIVPPEAYFNTQDEAFNHAQASKDTIIAAVRKLLDLGTFKPIDLDTADFIPQPHGPTTKEAAPEKPKEATPFPYPSVN